jgi:hypothetical protein
MSKKTKRKRRQKKTIKMFVPMLDLVFLKNLKNKRYVVHLFFLKEKK